MVCNMDQENVSAIIRDVNEIFPDFGSYGRKFYDKLLNLLTCRIRPYNVKYCLSPSYFFIHECCR